MRHWVRRRRLGTMVAGCALLTACTPGVVEDTPGADSSGTDTEARPRGTDSGGEVSGDSTAATGREGSSGAPAESSSGDDAATTTGGAVGTADGTTAAPTGGTDESGSGDGTTGGLALPEECLPQALLDGLDSAFVCEALPIVNAPIEWMPHDCHTQGLGVHSPTQRFVVTCEDEGGGDSGRVVTFPMEADGKGQHPAVAALEIFQDRDTTHPSDIQIDEEGDFVVAMTGGAGDLSHFRSVNLAADGQAAEVVRSVLHEQGHVGAVARARLDTEAVGPRTFVVGCGYDCDDLSVYQTPRPGVFELDVYAPTADLVVPGIDEEVGAYNALHLLPRCEDGQPLLVATHGSQLDVWSVADLGTEAPTISKIAAREIDEDVVLHGDRPIFYEGMTLEVTEEGVIVWAAPHDFGNGGCPAGTRCMQFVYRCSFGV